MKKLLKGTLMAATLSLGLSSFSGVADASNFKDTGSKFVFDHNYDEKYDYHLREDFYGNINKHSYAISKYLLSTKGNYTDVTYDPGDRISPESKVVIKYSKGKGGFYSGGEAFNIVLFEKRPQTNEFINLTLKNVSWDGSTAFDQEYQVALRESIYKVFGSKAGYSIYANLYYSVLDAKKGKLKEGITKKNIAGYKVEIANYNSILYVGIKF